MGNKAAGQFLEFDEPHSMSSGASRVRREEEERELAQAITADVLSQFFRIQRRKRSHADRMADFSEAISEVVHAKEDGSLSEADTDTLVRLLASNFVAGSLRGVLHFLFGPDALISCYDAPTKRSGQ